MRNIFLLAFICFFTQGVWAQKELSLAQKYLNSAEYENARILFQEIHDKQPNNVRAFVGLFESLYGEENKSGMESLLKRQKRRAKEDPMYYACEGLFLLRIAGDTSASELSFQRAQELMGSSRGYIYQLEKFYSSNSLVSAHTALLQSAIKERYNTKQLQTLINLFDAQQEEEKLLDILFWDLLSQQKSVENTKRYIVKLGVYNPSFLGKIKARTLRSLREHSENPDLLELLIWQFVQQKDFDSAFAQEKVFDKRWNLQGERIIELYSVALQQEEDSLASDIYDYIVKEYTLLNERVSRIYLMSQRTRLARYSREKKQRLAEDCLAFLNTYQWPGNEGVSLLYAQTIVSTEKKEDLEKAIDFLEDAILRSQEEKYAAELMLYLADILVVNDQFWDALLLYSRVENAFEESDMGNTARYYKALVSFYQKDFQLALDRLNILKRSTTKRIANDALKWSLILQESLNLDSNTLSLELYSNAHLQLKQGNLNSAIATLDMLAKGTSSELLVDDALFLKATILEDQQKYDEALELYSILAVETTSILRDNALYRKGDILLYQFKEIEQAKKAYQTILEDIAASYWLSAARLRIREIEEQNTL